MIEDFPHSAGGHCGSTCMRDMLRFYGHGYTEDMMFGLGSGVDFVFFKNPEMAPPVFVGGRVHNLEENIASSLGVGLTCVTEPDAGKAWAAVKAMLDAGTPAMVVVDVYDLDYLRAKRHFSAHRIILVGYDDERGVAFVADNDREEIQECSLESLAKARTSLWPPVPAQNATYIFDVPAELVPLEPAIPAAISREVDKYLTDGPGAGRSLYDMWPGRISMGIEGLKDFADDMASWPVSMSDEDLTLLCKNIYVSLEKGGTGYGGNFRRMYGRFLLQAAAPTGCSRLLEIGNEMVAIGEKWSELSFIFKDLSAVGARAVEKAHPIALELYDRELEAFSDLKEAAWELRGR